MTYWNNIYTHLDPVALDLGFISVQWYGIMFISALLTALFVAKWIAKKDKIPLSAELLDNYFVWVSVGVILGARIGYVVFYDPNTIYYLTQPWQIFNPFVNGEFKGISGMSYHGAVIGFLLSTFAFKYKYKKTDLLELFDLVALAIPLGYTFGRIGNFLNQELVGRYTEVSWGIYVDGVLRHPSQLYEAFLEGILVFAILFMYRSRKRFSGELIALYGVLYASGRFVAEFFREPDAHIGFIYADWMTKGQALSLSMIIFSIFLYVYLCKKSKI